MGSILYIIHIPLDLRKKGRKVAQKGEKHFKVWK